jgi:hypothetical protein
LSLDIEKVVNTIIEQALMGDREYQKLCFDRYAKHEVKNHPNDFKRLVLSALKNTDWVVNDVQFDEDNVVSINIKFATKFNLGNCPWDPRD